MKKLISILFALSACVDETQAQPLDAGVTVDAPSCSNTVVETCGPRPARPSSGDAQEVEVWAHDIDLWAKCAESATGSR